MMQLARTRVGMCVLALVMSAAIASAQQASGIAGVVKDTSGGVLPGVTVEASSPALIERTRTVITDNDGRYNIVGLVPGTYAVSFALPGFGTQVRDGIELTAGFTAAVNADLQVGSACRRRTSPARTRSRPVSRSRKASVTPIPA